MTNYPSANQFAFAGYSQVASHHHKPLGPKDINEVGAKKMVTDMWRNENYVLTKVIPLIKHQNDLSPDVQYPPGLGVPQWRLVDLIPCTVVAIVKDYPNGVYIPTISVRAK